MLTIEFGAKIHQDKPGHLGNDEESLKTMRGRKKIASFYKRIDPDSAIGITRGKIKPLAMK